MDVTVLAEGPPICGKKGGSTDMCHLKAWLCEIRMFGAKECVGKEPRVIPELAKTP